MSERIEWELVPRVRPDRQDLVEDLAEEILELDAALELAGDHLSEDDEERLLDLHARMANCLLSPCEAAEAPLLRVRTAWQDLAAQTFASLPDHDALDEETFLQLMGQQHDCAMCDGKSKFAGVSGVPCEFDLTPLATILPQDELCDSVQFELAPDEMLRLAAEVEVRKQTRSFSGIDHADARLYLGEMERYLRFWARLGFGVAPAFVEEDEE